ncbi:etm [Antheraea pernyi nucleopolyhedrovirus]|uniref:etm n=1 Tax=Antheraea pernyi nuclear polyhedrosis virus TaxID=161494 RepID=UPI000159708C|nr:etm [Antheraea pernyi nucleopolyhedrovirus]ABS76418.1 etm [Antheraea pernyi nucleopolyhedrovirus]
MDALQNVRVRIDKHHACRRALAESPNRVTFAFDRLKPGALAADIEISGLRQPYECLGKMVVGDAVVYVRQHSAGGKVTGPVGGVVDSLTAVLKNGFEFIELDVRVAERGI